MSHQPSLRSWTELDLANWEANLHEIAKRVGNQLQQTIPVVKANAYGHGLALLPQDLLHRTHGVAVAQPQEATELRKLGFLGRIYLLSPCYPAEFPEVMETNSIPLISTPEELLLWENAAAGWPGPLSINLELDTGMGRSGLLSARDSEIGNLWPRLRNLTLESISSHLASADENEGATATQNAQFQCRVDQFWAAGVRPKFFHLSNSAGAMALPQPAPWLIRTGIALYGCAPIPAFQASLKAPLSWYARVLLVRELPAGSPISYGGTYTCPKPARVASLAVGYADGYPRLLSGRKAHVLIAGSRCPVLGRITMDQLMVDVSHLPPSAVVPGTVATLLGGSGANTITAQELAELANTIPYEIFTSIGPRVRRMVV